MNHSEENQPTEIDPTPLTYTDLKRWLGIWVLLISLALLAWALKPIMLLFAVVFLVAMVLNPIVAFLERRRIHRGLAVALLALGFVAVFCAGTLLSDSTAWRSLVVAA
jgi:predicted PurR-regulated permease PerM